MQRIPEMYIFTREFERIDEISNYEYLEIERNYRSVSKVLLRVPRNSQNERSLQHRHIIVFTDDLTHGYIIEHLAYLNENNGDLIEVYAYSLNYLLSQVVIPRQITYRGNVEDVVKSIITQSAINPNTPNRIIPNLTLAPNVGINGTIASSVTGSNLLDASFNIMNAVDGSIDVLFDFEARTLPVFTWRGLDFSVEQNLYNHVYFSQEFDNVLRQKYYTSFINYKNVAYVAGEGEGINRTVVVVNDEITGDNRRELYVDARDLQREYYDGNNGTVILSEAEYADSLRQRGMERLAESLPIEFFESIAIDNQFVFGRDYNIGDKVTFQDRSLGVLLNVRVTSVRTIVQNGLVTITPSFGNGVIKRNGVN